KTASLSSGLPPNPPRPLRSLRCIGRVARPQEKFDQTTFGRTFATKRKALMEQYDFLRCSATYLQKVLYRDDRFILYNCESACSLGHSLECISTRQLFQSRLNFLSNPEVDPSVGARQDGAEQ